MFASRRRVAATLSVLLSAISFGCGSKSTTPSSDQTGGSSGNTGGSSGGSGGSAGAAGSGGSAGAGGSGGSNGSGGAASSGKSEWLWRGGDVGSNYNNTNETTISVGNAAQLHEAWTYMMPTAVNGISAAAGGMVYVLSTSGLRALDTTGKRLWTSPDISGTSSPALQDGTLYVLDISGYLHAVAAADGHTIWTSARLDSNANERGYSSPVVFEKLVIVGSASTEESVARANATFRGSIIAYDKDTGMEVWRHYTVDPPSNGVAVWSTPVVDPTTRMVFGATGNNYTETGSDTSDALFALKVDTGELIWNTQITNGDVYTSLTQKSADSDFGANPILFEATINGAKQTLLGAGQKSGVFTALDRMTGAAVWNLNLSSGSAIIGGILNNGAFDGEHLLLAGNHGTSTGPGSEPSNGESTGTSRLAAVNPADGSIVWERQLPAFVWSPITVANGVGFVSYEKHLQAFNTKTGEKLAVFDAAGTIASGASIADGHVYFGSGLSYYIGTDDNIFHCLTLP